MTSANSASALTPRRAAADCAPAARALVGRERLAARVLEDHRARRRRRGIDLEVTGARRGELLAIGGPGVEEHLERILVAVVDQQVVVGELRGDHRHRLLRIAAHQRIRPGPEAHPRGRRPEAGEVVDVDRVHQHQAVEAVALHDRARALEVHRGRLPQDLGRRGSGGQGRAEGRRVAHRGARGAGAEADRRCDQRGGLQQLSTVQHLSTLAEGRNGANRRGFVTWITIPPPRLLLALKGLS
ncbi:MAG: hypothetical protein U1F18_11850 [Steroidobacteraceae bacterium]